jgi:hypothetical protein
MHLYRAPAPDVWLGMQAMIVPVLKSGAMCFAMAVLSDSSVVIVWFAVKTTWFRMIAHALDVFAVIQAPVVRISSLLLSVTAMKFTLGQLRGVACYAVKFTNHQWFAHVRDVFIYTPMLTVPVFHQLQLAVDAIFGMGQTFVFLESVLSIIIASRTCPERRCLIVLLWIFRWT